MEKNLSFFRVFDLAFFVPGALLLTSLMAPKWADTMKRADTLVPADNVALVVIWVVLAVYGLGLVVHALHRLLWARAKLAAMEGFVARLSSRRSAAEAPSLAQAVSSASCEDLASYFWYLRATCRNLAVALLLSLPGFLGADWLSWGWVLTAAVALFVLFLLLAGDYDRALQKATARLAKEKDGGQATARR